MDRLEQQLEAIGRQAAQWVDEAAATSTAEVVSEARKRFLNTLPLRPKRRSPALLLAAAVALVGVMVLVGVGLRAPSPVTFAMGADGAGQVGQWLETRGNPLELRFSEGTRVSLGPTTKFEVERTSASGAELHLAYGRAVAAVNHHPDARWRVHAGPFTVRVTGTEFEVAWEPGADVFEISLRSGSVVVSGPTLGPERSVRTGESLRVDLGQRSPKTSASARKDPTESRSEPAPSRADDGSASGGDDGSTEPSPSPPPRPKPKEAGWRDALQQGHRREALEAIERRGTTDVLSSATPNELNAISDAARLERRPGLATQALVALRSRHGVRGQTAYLLGKIAADQLHSPAEALKWFDTYLRESPNGALAEQALGRLVELQAGTQSGRVAAARYLERYPTGSYASVAHREVGPDER